MHYKTKSIISISVMLLVMILVGYTLASVKQPSVTGLSVADCKIECRSNTDCFDGDSCTTDVCTSPFDCNSKCIKTKITSCMNNDGCCPEGCNSINDKDCS